MIIDKLDEWMPVILDTVCEAEGIQVASDGDEAWRIAKC
jgi:hypothetical protein